MNRILLAAVVVIVGTAVTATAVIGARAILHEQECKRYRAALNVALSDPKSDELPKILSQHDRNQIREGRKTWKQTYKAENERIFDEAIERAITVRTPPLEPRISRDGLPLVDLRKASFEADTQARTLLEPRWQKFVSTLTKESLGRRGCS